MIKTYTGTPGSGKSLHMAKNIMSWLKLGRSVIGTVQINRDLVKKYKGTYFFVDIYSLNPKDLIEFARKNCVKGKESQVLLVIDECQRIFNSRDWNAKDRRSWNEFFQVHRHFGFDVLLITQFTKLLDKQLLSLIEYNHVHRKVKNFGMFGFLMSAFTGGRLFVCVSEWFPIHSKIGSDFFLYNKKLGSFYDSYMMFDDDFSDFNEVRKYLDQQAGVSDSSDVSDESETQIDDENINDFISRFSNFLSETSA